MKESVFTPLVRFIEHVPKGDDPELMLLKCHLLVEEALTKLIAGAFKHPDYLPDASLKFTQKVALAKAVDKIDHEIWIWGALERLNKARNALSHLLDDAKLEERVKEFIEYVETNTKHLDSKPHIEAPFGRFGWAAFIVFSVVSARANFDLIAARHKTMANLLSGEPRTTALSHREAVAEK